MARTTKDRLRQLQASEEKNRENEREFREREWMIAHYEERLAELMEKGAHHTHPWITERYENDLYNLYKGYRIN